MYWTLYNDKHETMVFSWIAGNHYCPAPGLVLVLCSSNSKMIPTTLWN